MTKATNPHIDKGTTFSSNRLTDLKVIGRWILLGGLLLAAVGASFAPWVIRPPAALVLTAPDLAEFVKFLPEVRDGTLTVHRLWFLLPLFVATLSMPMVIATHQLDFPCWARWPILAIAISLSLTLLPPVWSPSVLSSAEFRLQTVASLLCLSLVAVSRWLRAIPIRPLAWPLIPLSLAAPGLATWQFITARNAIARPYNSPITPAWGMWTTLTGFALVICGLVLILLAFRTSAGTNRSE
jgi:hypothetical protein